MQWYKFKKMFGYFFFFIYSYWETLVTSFSYLTSSPASIAEISIKKWLQLLLWTPRHSWNWQRDCSTCLKVNMYATLCRKRVNSCTFAQKIHTYHLVLRLSVQYWESLNNLSKQNTTCLQGKQNILFQIMGNQVLGKKLVKNVPVKFQLSAFADKQNFVSD